MTFERSTAKSVQISPEHQLPRGGRGKVMWLDPEDLSVPVGSVLRRCHLAALAATVIVGHAQLDLSLSLMLRDDFLLIFCQE